MPPAPRSSESSRPNSSPAPVDPPQPASDRSRAVAVALGFVTGIFGGHRYYAGKIKTGLLMTVTFGGLGIWWLTDMIMLLGGEFRDGRDRKITIWMPDDLPAPGTISVEQFNQLREEIEYLRGEVEDVHERIDFQERRLQRGN